MGGIINLGVNRFFSRGQEPSAISGDAEAPSGVISNSAQGGVRGGGQPIEISAQIGVVNLASQDPARQLPSSPSSPSSPRQSSR